MTPRTTSVGACAADERPEYRPRGGLARRLTTGSRHARGLS